MNDIIRAALLSLFTGSIFRRKLESRWIYYGSVEGIIIAVLNFDDDPLGPM
jgi:hypothetical protein